MEQEASTHAGETKYEGRRRERGEEEEQNRVGGVAETLGCPRMNKGW